MHKSQLRDANRLCESGEEALAGAKLVDDDVWLALFDLQIAGVRLFEVNVERLTEASSPKPTQAPILSTEVSLSQAGPRIIGRLVVEIEAPSHDAPHHRLRFAYDLMLAKQQGEAIVPDDEESRYRLACTVLTMLWPYAREFGHDMMRRMEVPIVILPTLDKLALGRRGGEVTAASDPAGLTVPGDASGN